MIRAGVVGAGYVGLTTAVCVAERGVDTVSVDTDQARVEMLTAGLSPIDEPDLEDAMRAGMAAGRLRFTDQFDALADRDVVFVCVPTPSGADGAADLRAVDAVADRLADVLAPDAVIAVKSTVPVGTTRRLTERVAHRGIRVVSTPEFLREGHAVHDSRHPDRVVIGAFGDAEAEVALHACGTADAPVLRMSPESAELAKYACNAFLAVKLSYANSLAQLASALDADVTDVTSCMGADPRIGGAFLAPGPGWGGSCLPKDTAALLHLAHQVDVPVAEVRACRATNAAQADRVVAALGRAMTAPWESATVAALGLTFKAGISDTRDSPALEVCLRLAETGAQVHAFDPRLSAIDPEIVKAARATPIDDPYQAMKAVDAVVVLTEWPEFRDLDWAAVAEGAPDAVVIDTRNLLDRDVVERAGLTYLGNGRPAGY